MKTSARWPPLRLKIIADIVFNKNYFKKENIMKKEEAIKQIESISEILNSGNQILLSVPHLISIGIVLCLIPIIDFTTQSFTFGCKISGTTTLITNLAIYYMIFFVLHRIISKIYKIEKSRTKNPLIIKAFKIKYAFTAFFALGSTALGFSGNAILIYPLIYVFIGLLYNLIGTIFFKNCESYFMDLHFRRNIIYLPHFCY